MCDKLWQDYVLHLNVLSPTTCVNMKIPTCMEVYKTKVCGSSYSHIFWLVIGVSYTCTYASSLMIGTLLTQNPIRKLDQPMVSVLQLLNYVKCNYTRIECET
jgi:hypothetical protein